MVDWFRRTLIHLPIHCGSLLLFFFCREAFSVSNKGDQPTLNYYTNNATKGSQELNFALDNSPGNPVCGGQGCPTLGQRRQLISYGKRQQQQTRPQQQHRVQGRFYAGDTVGRSTRAMGSDGTATTPTSGGIGGLHGREAGVVRLGAILSLGDMNGDGLDDILVSDDVSETVWVLVNDGNCRFLDRKAALSFSFQHFDGLDVLIADEFKVRAGSCAPNLHIAVFHKEWFC